MKVTVSIFGLLMRWSRVRIAHDPSFQTLKASLAGFFLFKNKKTRAFSRSSLFEPRLTWRALIFNCFATLVCLISLSGSCGIIFIRSISFKKKFVY